MNTLLPIICPPIIFLFPFAEKFRYSRQALNPIVISLGLPGTFAGIIYSLLLFDPENITSSLPLLLTNSKTRMLGQSIVMNPVGSVQTPELFQDKSLYDLVRNTHAEKQIIPITEQTHR